MIKYKGYKAEKIKVFLPEEFKYTNTQNYLNQIAQSGDSSAYYAEKKRFKDIQDSGKKIYLFEYLKGASIVKVLPERYVAFTNSDAKYMLGIVDNIIKANNTEIDFEIMESQFKGNKNISIFKVILQDKKVFEKYAQKHQLQITDYENSHQKSFPKPLENYLKKTFEN